MTKISCVIHTFNSALYLEKVLQSVQFCDEIVVIDMQSTDRTVEIAHKHNAKIVLHENIGFADPARQFGVEQCSHPWVLSLDSDEIIPSKLAEKIVNIVRSNEFELICLSRRNFMFGREILGSGWGYKNDVIPRVFKKGCLTYGNEVHNFIHITPGTKITKIISRETSIIHFNYDSISHFIKKLDAYTGFETEKPITYNCPLISMTYHCLREILGRFIVLRGYRDGWLGLYLSMSMAYYRATVIAKKSLLDRDKVTSYYNSYDANA
jgi:glycosyltransferase involved in cell wall biosynthesis